MALIQTVHLSMANFKSAPVVPAVQNDTDRQVKMIIDDFQLTAGLTGKITFVRSDGTHYEANATLDTATNSFTADIDQALTQPGRTMVQLKVTDTLTVSTFSFVIFVEEDTSGTVTPQEGIDLATAVEAAEAAADRAESAAESVDADEIWDAIGEIKTAIDYHEPVLPYILTNDDFVSGLWANGTWRTDGNYGKYKSNYDPVELEDFTITVTTETLTDLVVSLVCFDENKDYIANFVTNNAGIQSGSWVASAASILSSKPTTKYVSYAIGKLSGSTYYDLPSDLVITVTKTGVSPVTPVTIADRVEALEEKTGAVGSSVITVAKVGGDYTTISDAVTNAADSASNKVTILIKPGVYDEHIHVGGDRYLSFVGENRDTCIIRSHTGMYTDAPLWIDGNFTVENLTLQMLDDEAPDTWTPGTSQSDPETMLPGYALHIDGGSNSSIDSVYGYKLGAVRNCTLYSVAFPAIGAGLHANQKLIFDNCDFVRVTSAKYHNNQYQYYTNYSGAMIMHDSTHSGDENQNLEIKNCRFLCNLGKSATFAFRHGTPANVKYAVIDSTFWCDETESSIVDDQSTGGVLLGYSHGNNNSAFNA